MPHVMFWSAIAKPKVEAEIASSAFNGGRNSPRLWRIPMLMEMIVAATTSMAIT